MIRNIYICLLVFIATGNLLFSQSTTGDQLDIQTTYETVKGTLVNPDGDEKKPLVILIPGSGTTNRDGNNAMSKNNSLKYLAESLVDKGIATYRYDKTVLNFTPADTAKINALNFDMLIKEASDVIDFFKKQDQFSKVIVAGHSQGSLVGMIAAVDRSDAFISLAGMGRSVDVLLEEQIAKQAPVLLDETKRVLIELRNGNTVDDYNPFLANLFNKSVQPFLISYMKYNPASEIGKLKQPVLIVQGDNDIQISVTDAEILHKACAQSKIVLIQKMNHLFKKIEGERAENMASYANPDLPIMEELTFNLVQFINELN